MYQAFLRFFLGRTISRKDRIFFVHHLSLILRAGVPLPKALLILSNQAKSKRFSKILRNMELSIQKGNSFEQSLQRYKWAFSESFIGMVKIGETKGDIQAVLNGYYELLHKQDKIRSKVRSAMIYPLVVICALILVSIFAVTFIFPRLIELVAEFDTELPLVTKIAIGISTFLTQHGLILAVLLVILSIVFFISLQTRAGKWIFHYLFLHVPLFGKIVRNYNLAVLSRNFGSLLSAGVPVTDALETTASTVRNIYYQSSLRKARRVVGRGETINSAFEQYTFLFPELVQQIIVVGEQSGTTDEMFLEIADFYEDQLMSTLDTLASIIEPFIILTLGAGVVFLALSVLMPLYTLTASI